MTDLSARHLHAVVAVVTEGSQKETSEDTRKVRTRFRGDSADARHCRVRTGTADDAASSRGTSISSAESHGCEPPRMILSIPPAS